MNILLRKLLFGLSLGVMLLSSACSQSEKKERTMQETRLNYLALGDSYTFGESVDPEYRWPNILAEQLSVQSCLFNDPMIIARTGWTSGELTEALKNENLLNEYDLVSLLIGVNDQFRSQNVQGFEERFSFLLDTAISLAGGNEKRVFVVSIPDYGVTPFGQQRDPEKIAQEIDEFNRVKLEICESRGVLFINITDISRLAKDNKALIAGDSLHPSALMYEKWVERMFLPVKELSCD